MHDSVFSLNKSLRRIPQSIMSIALFIKLRGPFVDYCFRCWWLVPFVVPFLRCSVKLGNLLVPRKLVKRILSTNCEVDGLVEVYNQISSASIAVNSTDELEIAIRHKFTLAPASSRNSMMLDLYLGGITLKYKNKNTLVLSFSLFASYF